MIKGLQHTHNLFRYIILILLVLATIKLIAGHFGKKEFTEGDRKLTLFTMIAAHIQLLIGLGLYFSEAGVSKWKGIEGGIMKNDVARFWAVEHISMMILGILLITFGYMKMKRAATSAAKFKLWWTFALGLFIILSRIPWPFSMEGIARPWF